MIISCKECSPFKLVYYQHFWVPCVIYIVYGPYLNSNLNFKFILFYHFKICFSKFSSFKISGCLSKSFVRKQSFSFTDVSCLIILCMKVQLEHMYYFICNSARQGRFDVDSAVKVIWMLICDEDAALLSDSCLLYITSRIKRS